MKRLQRGFSLIELMIVIAIIGILAAIAIPSYQTYVLKSKLGELLSASSAAQLAAAEYVQSSGTSDCSGMPIVVTGAGAGELYFTGTSVGAFAYPTTNLVASVTIDNNCDIEVQGAGNQWGSNEATSGVPVVTGTHATDSSGGYSWTCNVRSELGPVIPYAPSTCPAA